MTYSNIFNKWIRDGKPIPAPSIVKYMIIGAYAKAFEIQILVETGTFKGGLIDYSKNIFDRIYSIELNDEMFVKAKIRFKDEKHVTILQGDSSIVLPKVLCQIEKPCLFWLDSHYSGGVTSVGEKQTPIIDELDHIFVHPIKSHVILIDDARCFGVKKDYPSIYLIKRMISQNYPDFSIELNDDLICAHPSGKIVSIDSLSY
jgi:hypothetical protein